MVKIKQAIFGVAATAAIALLPMAPAMADGHGFRPYHPFGFGHGIFGAAVALATLPLAIASSVVSGVGESIASYPSPGYASPGYATPGYASPGYAAPTYAYAPAVVYAPRPYYAPYPGYYAPRVAYGPRGYYAPRPGYYNRGYYRSGGNSYPRR
jgi:hypothetical protein